MVVTVAGRPGVNVRRAVEWERNIAQDHAPIQHLKREAITATASVVQERRQIACIRRAQVSFQAFVSGRGQILYKNFERKTFQNNTYSTTSERKFLIVAKEFSHVHGNLCHLYKIWWNLLIADTLYGEHFSVAETTPKDGWKHVQSLRKTKIVGDSLYRTLFCRTNSNIEI